MKVLNENSDLGKKIQEVEDLLNKHGLVITGGNLCIQSGVHTFGIRLDGMECSALPRIFDEEKFVLIEH